jgi:FkbM family methyltransferase
MMKVRLEAWLARGLRLRRAQLPIPGPAVLDLPVREHLAIAIARDGCYECATLERIVDLCRGASSFLDIGAQFGQFTLAVSAVLSSHGRVVAVEPNPQNYLELCANLALNGRTNVYPVLAAAAQRDSLLRLVPQTRGNTGETTTRSDLRSGEMIVPALSLTEILRHLEVTCVDVMKLDVEGFESEVLRGLFQGGGPKPRHVFFEYLPERFDTCEETVTLIHSAGYSIRQVNGAPFKPQDQPVDDNLWASLPSY